MDTKTLTEQERELRNILKRKLLGLSSLERSIARQRSRILFLMEGDVDTCLFQQSACHRQRRNAICTLKNGAELATGNDELAGMVDTYYHNLFGRALARPHSLDMSLLQLPSVDLPHLDIQFTEEEVEKVIKSMPLDKVPEPDGFTGRFFATCWTIIKGDIMRAFHAFHQGDMCRLPAINKAIVALLPKMDGA